MVAVKLPGPEFRAKFARITCGPTRGLSPLQCTAGCPNGSLNVLRNRSISSQECFNVAITMGRRHFYEFAPFRVEPEERALLRDGQIVPLPPKAFDVLLVLIQKKGRLVLKDELMKTVWPDTFVEEANLSQNIFLLRKALREKANQPHYIVTVPGRGYRFGSEVNEISGGESSVPSQSPTPLPPDQTKAQRYHHHLFWAGLAALLVLTTGGIDLCHSLRRIQPLPGRVY